MINAFSEYLNGYATVFALCLSVPVIILIFFVVEYRRLKRDVATINNLLVAKSGYSKNTHCKNVHGKNAFNPRIKLHSKASTSLWNSISALLAKHQNIDQHKNTYNEIIALTSSLTDKITNISQVKQSIVELLAKQLGSGVVSIMLIGVAPKNHPDKTASLNIDATYGLNIKRLQDLILTTFENLVLFHKQACGNTAKVKKMCEVDKPSKNFSNKFNYLKNSYSGSHREIGTFAVLPQAWGYHLSSDSKSPLTELGIGLSLNIPLMLNGKIIGGLWIGFNENSVNLEPQKRQIIQGIAEHAGGILVSARHTEEERKTSSQTNHFLVGLSHDLKTPGTNALYWLRDMLGNEQNNLTDEQLGRLKQVEQSLEQQLSMVGDVLEYAKLQKGLNEVYKKCFQVKPTILELLNSFSFLAELKNIKFNTENLDDALISFDFRHFQRIMSNMLSNAIKYSFEGKEIFIKTKILGENIEICVLDSGIGVPVDEEKFLFQEFTRLKNSRHVQGSGFGLVLCRMLAELNSAEVFFRRHQNYTEFGLTVKRVNTAVAKQSGDVKPFTLKEATCQPKEAYKSILIIDDDPIICKTNLRFLSGMAERFYIANSIEETKNILKECTPELIVTDLHLKDGLFTDLLSKQDAPAFKHLLTTPIIILTGYTKNKELVDLEQKYTIMVLEKPTTRQELQRAVSVIAINTA